MGDSTHRDLIDPLDTMGLLLHLRPGGETRVQQIDRPALVDGSGQDLGPALNHWITGPSRFSSDHRVGRKVFRTLAYAVHVSRDSGEVTDK